MNEFGIPKNRQTKIKQAQAYALPERGTYLLKDDIIVSCNKDTIITKWDTLKPNDQVP